MSLKKSLKSSKLSSYLHEVTTVTFLPLLVEVITGELRDGFRNLVGHDADAELANYFAWNDSLCSRLTEGSLNAVEGEGRVPPACHQGSDLNNENQSITDMSE